MLIDDAIAIAAIHSNIVLRQREKAVFLNICRWGRLGRVIAKQLAAVIDAAIIVANKSKPGVI